MKHKANITGWLVALLLIAGNVHAQNISGEGIIPPPKAGGGTGCNTSGSLILKGNGSGGCANASAGTDYAPATSGTSLLMGNNGGGFNNAVPGTDYQPAIGGNALSSHIFANRIDSAGNLTGAQPDCSDLTNAAAHCGTDASELITNTVPVARGGRGCGAPVTIANLPGSPIAGMHCDVTNATTCVVGATVVGGGSSIPLCPLIYTGTQWLVSGSAVATGGGVSAPTEQGNPTYYSSTAASVVALPHVIHAGAGTLQTAFNRCPASAQCEVHADQGNNYSVTSPLWVGQATPQTLYLDNASISCSDPTTDTGGGAPDDCIVLGPWARLYCSNKGVRCDCFLYYREQRGASQLSSNDCSRRHPRFLAKRECLQGGTSHLRRHQHTTGLGLQWHVYVGRFSADLADGGW